MLIYWLMLLIPGVLYVMLMPLKEEHRNRTVITAFFLIFGTMLALRSADCGVDLRVYEYYFQNTAQIPWSMLHKHELETGFMFYLKLVTTVTDNFQVFIALTSVICVLPIYYLYQKNCECSFLQILLFVNMSIFSMMFSGLRQAMAISFGVFAYCAVRDGKIIRYLLFTGLAYLFHESAFILLLLYPMYHIRLKQKHTVVILIALFVLLLFNEQIFRLLGLLAGLLGIGYTVSVSSTGAYTTIILFFLFYLFALLILDEEKSDDEVLGLRNILLLALAIQIFAPLHNTVTRLGYYYLVYIPVLIPKVITRTKRQFAQITVLAHILMCGFFLFYFLQTAYTGQDTLRIFPYMPFWGGY